MEFAGFHLQHQLQEEFDQCVTSATPHDYKPSTTQSWIPSNIYNGCTNGFMTENFTNSREQGHKYDMTDSLRTSTGQDFGFHNGKSFTQQQAYDLLVSSPSRHVNEKEFSPSENLYHLQKPINEGMALTKSYNFGHISSFTREVAMTKRPSKCSRSQESEAKAKKSRPSCPPLKVRKENLGDRIQTLQRLVAPFGKTSTVSVLTEAIGYTHVLHEQIQTLSIPYMKFAQSKSSRIVQLDSKKVDSREFKPDLRSRGLCLVPLSFASSINRWA
ncbi:transcription factor bHLH112-like [Gastrolobium bilobum]|uniref:transcription factor bHLH112-like n=1 Tax=Gastrolobium bilobum TaxID=150636 RepID=UPI002AB2B94C|nr:transcription factor bHLH112-like [Gastrolobium bilobum]